MKDEDLGSMMKLACRRPLLNILFYRTLKEFPVYGLVTLKDGIKAM